MVKKHYCCARSKGCCCNSYSCEFLDTHYVFTCGLSHRRDNHRRNTTLWRRRTSSQPPCAGSTDEKALIRMSRAASKVHPIPGIGVAFLHALASPWWYKHWNSIVLSGWPPPSGYHVQPFVPTSAPGGHIPGFCKLRTHARTHAHARTSFQRRHPRHTALHAQQPRLQLPPAIART
jgi:hypothetical protein